jgi:hypothetical protein
LFAKRAELRYGICARELLVELGSVRKALILGDAALKTAS